MLGASADRLHGGPHVFVLGHEIPASGEELIALYAAALVDALRRARHAVPNRKPPSNVAIPLDDGVRVSTLEAFLREEGGVDSAVDDGGSALTGDASHLIAAKRIAGVDADADNIADSYRFRVDLFERLVDQDGLPATLGVAAARTKSQRGVITAVPKELSLGLTRWTRKWTPFQNASTW